MTSWVVIAYVGPIMCALLGVHRCGSGSGCSVRVFGINACVDFVDLRVVELVKL